MALSRETKERRVNLYLASAVLWSLFLALLGLSLWLVPASQSDIPQPRYRRVGTQVFP